MNTTITTTKALHAAAIAALNSSVYPDGTYDITTKEAVSFSEGYQVSFCQLGDDYTDDDYDFIVAMFTEISSDSTVYAGKFGGEPEISFHFSNREIAIRYAKMFNQYSIWDWKHDAEIRTGGTVAR